MQKYWFWLFIWIATIFNCFESHTMSWAFSRIANWRSQTAHTKGASLAFLTPNIFPSVFFCFEWFGTVKYNHAILIICIQTLSQLRSVFTLIQCSLHMCLLFRISLVDTKKSLCKLSFEFALKLMAHFHLVNMIHILFFQKIDWLLQNWCSFIDCILKAEPLS